MSATTGSSMSGSPMSSSMGSTPPPSYSSAGTGSAASFDIRSTFRNAIALVRNPVPFMTSNSENDVPVKTLMINYVAVLAAIPFIATLIGDLWYYSAFGYIGFAGFFGYYAIGA
ncbi:MAG: hypothetical protein OK439_04635, partial [Thaumarchaeota archaeon]|nr:hypothetical protein [Nitrososphaerota archaeon]